MKSYRNIFCLLVLFYQLGCTTVSKNRNPSSVSKKIYSGSSDFKIITVKPKYQEFDAYQDVLSPSKEEDLQRPVREALQSAAAVSMIHLANNFNQQDFTTSQDSLFDKISNMVRTIANEVSEAVIRNPSLDQFSDEAFMLPIGEERKNFFYGAEKINLSSFEKTSIFVDDPRSNKFKNQATEAIQKYRLRMSNESKDPVYLLGWRRFLSIVKPKNNFGERELASRLTFRVLLGVKEGFIPNEVKNDQVELSGIQIPNGDGRGVTMSLLFDINLIDRTESPMVFVEIGDFESFDSFEFNISQNNKSKFAPSLVGVVSKAKKISTRFTFSKLAMNLENQVVSDLQILTGAGLKWGPVNFTAGEFKVPFISTQIEGEVNKTIVAQKSEVQEKIENSIKDYQEQQALRLSDVTGELISESDANVLIQTAFDQIMRAKR